MKVLKKWGCTVLLVLLASGLTAQEVKVMSYNIKYDNVNDTVNNWNFRKEAMVQLLHHYGPHFVGMQEVLHNQLEYPDEHLADYAYIGVGRDDGKQKGEYSPILYNSQHFELLRTNTIWLSPTPEKVSKGWDAALERICTYALFKEKSTGKELYVFNTHFDHVGTEARKQSVNLILRQIKAVNTQNLPVVVTGDFNLEPDSEPIQLMQAGLTDGLQATQQPFYGPTGTFNGFDPNMVLDRRIDYIFVKNLQVQRYLHIDDRMENNMHISDHLPVLAKLKME
ncbi:endonuclease/exonuclease/phosphatase family protein [Maribacter litopenaei]|uniref:Endonuclease/exonuclease/phosphatase family protein n=1 Tax=Maribacter litopenaei TaxID=2976127 RepID=A0ABY5Y438_9FLAO|nr:endonuclease/exonuclease/phosphatase family protein [Maribacter litopenaei]UWX53782.1 endonuclease/exonuclease/phosphatase family protein [Maribacter litopenaei]